MTQDVLEERESGGAGFAAPTSADGAWAEGEGETKIRGTLVESFEFYVVRFENLEYRAPNKPGVVPSGTARALILKGPSGTVGERVFGDFYLGVGRTESTGEKVGDTWVKVPKSAEKFAEQTTAFQQLCNRIGRIGQLTIVRLPSQEESLLKRYCLGWAKGFDAIIPIRIDKRRDPARNTFAWEGIRGLADPAHDKKLKAAGKTAIEEAEQRIAERNAKATKASAATTESL
jgi:hypothetical protein